MSTNITPGPGVECMDCGEIAAGEAFECPRCGSEFIEPSTLTACDLDDACDSESHHFGTGFHVTAGWCA